MSPRTSLVVSARGARLEVRALGTMHLLHAFDAAADISTLAWGALGSDDDEEVVAAASPAADSVMVVTARGGDIVADVHVGAQGVAGVALSTRGHLLVAAEFGVGVSLFSIRDEKHIAFLRSVKSGVPGSMLFAWSPCGSFVALVTRKEGVDGICVLSLESGAAMMLAVGPGDLAGIVDIAAVRWVREHGILIWGAPLDPLGLRAVALLAPDGSVVVSGLPNRALKAGSDFEEDAGECVVASNDDDDLNTCDDADLERSGLGIKTVCVSRDGSLIAIGDYGGRLRVINLVKWVSVKSFDHNQPQIDQDVPPVIFRERTKMVPSQKGEHPSGKSLNGENSGLSANTPRMPINGAGRPKARSRKPASKIRTSYFEILEGSGVVEVEKRVRGVNAKSGKFGVGAASFSSDGAFLASRGDKSANVVFIWNVLRLRLAAVLILEADARCLRWSNPPEQQRRISTSSEDERDEPLQQLMVSSGGEYVYLWRPDGVAAVRVASETLPQGVPLSANKISWAHDNSAIVVSDSTSAKGFLAVYP